MDGEEGQEGEGALPALTSLQLYARGCAAADSLAPGAAAAALCQWATDRASQLADAPEGAALACVRHLQQEQHAALLPAVQRALHRAAMLLGQLSSSSSAHELAALHVRPTLLPAFLAVQLLLLRAVPSSGAEHQQQQQLLAAQDSALKCLAACCTLASALLPSHARGAELHATLSQGVHAVVVQELHAGRQGKHPSTRRHLVGACGCVRRHRRGRTHTLGTQSCALSQTSFCAQRPNGPRCAAPLPPLRSRCSGPVHARRARLAAGP